MAEGIVFVLMGLACAYFAPKDWFIARSDENFVLLLGEQAATVFNALIGTALYVIGLGHILVA